MKKLVMMLALALAVVSAKAASVDWQMNATASDVGTTVYLLTALGDYADTAALQAAAVDSGTVASLGRGKYGIAKSTAAGDSVTSSADFFFAVVASDGKSFNYVAANLGGSVYDPNAQQSSPGVFSSIDVAAVAAGTSKSFGGDVPEPTSGLLLLVGGAMLALRRRRG